MKKMLFSLLMLALCIPGLNAGINVKKPTSNFPTSFAIVVDKVTYEKVTEEIESYKNSVENEKLSTFLIVIENEKPEKIKSTLKGLYKNDNLEGAVFIGDIPIPMIRDAQHLTSAYKKNQTRWTFFETSVPSDRYYEDYDLKFDFLNKDEEKELCYYYSLRGDSPQIIEKEIYSSRIIPPFSDEHKYDLIRDYLQKAVAIKKQKNIIDDALVFTGNGYNSESFTSWTDKLTELRENYPNFSLPGNTLKFLDHSMSPDLKKIIINELERENLDIALFHAHGWVDTQYLLEFPKYEGIGAVKSIKRFLRSKLRTAKRRKHDVEEYKNHYRESYDIPDSWFEGAFEDSVIAADSIEAYWLDIYSDDLEFFSPQAKFIMFDECFNGSFHEENYITGRYIFGTGNVISACANSVNVLQDKWTNELIGLFNFGVSTGKWHKNINYLENHIFGDPTFHFTNNTGIDIDKEYYSIRDDQAKLKEKLASENIVLRTLAVNRLTKLLGDDYSKELVKIYNTDPSYSVRAMVFQCLARLNTPEFHNILFKTVYDPFEFIRRKSVTLMGRIGKDEYIPYLVDAMMNDQGSRVSFNAKTSLSVQNQELVSTELKKYFEGLPEYAKNDKIKKMLLDNSERNAKWTKDISGKIWDPGKKESKRYNAIRTIRNYNFGSLVPTICKFINDESQPRYLRIQTVEGIGWFTYSIHKNTILNELEKAQERINDELDPLYKEIQKTKTRLTYGCNSPLTP